MPKEEDTKINKSSISNSSSYEEMGEFWDEHSLDEYWLETEKVDFEINLRPNKRLTYYGIDENLSNKILSVAKRKGISAKTLLSSWIEEKLKQESA